MHKPAQIMISYAEEDSAIVEALAKSIEEEGYTAWYYGRNGVAGRFHVDETSEVIRTATAVLVLLSEQSVRSHQVESELVIAHEHNKPCIPVLFALSYERFAALKPNWVAYMRAASGVELESVAGIPKILPKIVAGLVWLGEWPENVSVGTAPVSDVEAGPLDNGGQSRDRGIDYTKCDFVRGLCFAENRFLEPLVTGFKLVRTQNGGAELRVEFDERTYTVWNNRGKEEVRSRIPNFEQKADQYQAEINAFLLPDQRKMYRFDDPEFPFRYASGGTLPVLSYRGKEYYCLIYRQVFPIGWNIANGGCDSKVELLSPIEAVERELREELVIIDPDKRKKRYVFEAEVGKSLERPEFAVARRFWELRHPEWGDLDSLEVVTIGMEPLTGPDSLTVELLSVPMEFTTSGCFLNINALDFGIEIDQVIRLAVDADACLLDGELLAGWVRDGRSLPTTVTNAPIGLFELDMMNAEFKKGSVDFRPDIFFWNGVEQSDTLENVIGKWLQEIKPYMSEQALQQYDNSNANKFDLCPVTRSLLSRTALHAVLQRGPCRRPV